jgi:membrane protein YdbS with pleckstrin-like domain
MNLTGKKNLQKGEVVLYYPRLHWMFLIRPIVCLTVAVLLFFTKEITNTYIKSAAHLATVNTIYTIALLTIFILAALYLLRKIIEFYLVQYSITNKRLILKKGVFVSTLVDMPIEKIESIICVQSLLGRIFNYGTLLASGIGGSLPCFKTIRKPHKVRRVIYDIIEKNKKITIIREDLPKPVKVKPVQKVPEVQYGIFVTSYPAGKPCT